MLRASHALSKAKVTKKSAFNDPSYLKELVTTTCRDKTEDFPKAVLIFFHCDLVFRASRLLFKRTMRKILRSLPFLRKDMQTKNM